MAYLVDLESGQAHDGVEVSRLGGKAFNTHRLLKMGENDDHSLFLVPASSVCVTTDAYDEWIASGALPRRLHADLAAYVASRVRGRRLAVRSSANVEDSELGAAAGQHDTYFIDADDAKVVAEAVERCFQSLRTARAMAYRSTHADYDESKAKMAVLLQEFVPSVRVSGVIFTANPVTGRRLEAVVNIVEGLGEDLVGGKLIPDRILIDYDRLDDVKSTSQLISDEQLRRLVRAALAIQREFNSLPQDIEFCFSNDIGDDGEQLLYVVQTRAITTLFPLPVENELRHLPPAVYWSMALTQGTWLPFSFLGASVYQQLVYEMMVLITKNRRLSPFVYAAGQRLFIDVALILTSPLFRFYLHLMGMKLKDIDETTYHVVNYLDKDKRFKANRQSWASWAASWVAACLRRPLATAQTLWTIFNFSLLYFQVLPMMINALIRPQKAAQSSFAASTAAVDGFRARVDACASLPQLLSLLSAENGLTKQIIRSRMAAGGPMIVAFRCKIICERLAASVGQDARLLTRGALNNPTTQMNAALASIARRIRLEASDEELRVFQQQPASELAARYQRRRLRPASVNTDIERFLSIYGLRGINEIDAGEARYVEDPKPLFNVLKALLSGDAISGEDKLTEAAAEADAWVQETRRKLRRERSWFSSWLFAFCATRVRFLIGLRELPKFRLVQLIGSFRLALVRHADAAPRLVAHGLLEREGDISLLTLDDLRRIELEPLEYWQRLVDERRRARARESLRRRVPTIMLSDGTSFYEGWRERVGRAVEGEEAPETFDDRGRRVLVGQGVSSGVVEGVARVIHDPRLQSVNVGEVLVARSSDPSWTVCYLAAAGVVNEVGGELVHGAVTARELGLPAVMAVTDATLLIKDGQRIQVDGNNGTVTLLE